MAIRKIAYLRAKTRAFQNRVLRWFASHGRDLPWRRTTDPWRILVSEIMLQQTQVDRVAPKYREFVARWPTPAALAAAPAGEVLALWSGLGYNRRALNVRRAAEAIVARHCGRVPEKLDDLRTLPGVGRYTAAAVAAFAWNRDVTLWDTNVRRVFMRLFHGGEFARRLPDDNALERTVAAALPVGRARDWYGALMDLGSAVCTGRTPACGDCPLASLCVAGAKFAAGKSPKRALIRKQPAFKGSRREKRGRLLRLLVANDVKRGVRLDEVTAVLGMDTAAIIADMEREDLIVTRRGRIVLP